jgi:hypothetical protein
MLKELLVGRKIIEIKSVSETLRLRLDDDTYINIFNETIIDGNVDGCVIVDVEYGLEFKMLFLGGGTLSISLKPSSFKGPEAFIISNRSKNISIVERGE